MQSDKKRIADIFKHAKHLEGIVCFLLGLGFKRTEEGRSKLVFISRRHGFVVKLAREGMFYNPSKRSTIGKFYLWPENAGSRLIRSVRWYLTFQPKADIRNRRKIFRQLEEELFMANTAWRCDAHDGNVALYRGKPVIIDY